MKTARHPMLAEVCAELRASGVRPLPLATGKLPSYGYTFWRSIFGRPPLPLRPWEYTLTGRAAWPMRHRAEPSPGVALTTSGELVTAGVTTSGRAGLDPAVYRHLITPMPPVLTGHGEGVAFLGHIGHVASLDLRPSSTGVPAVVLTHHGNPELGEPDDTETYPLAELCADTVEAYRGDPDRYAVTRTGAVPDDRVPDDRVTDDRVTVDATGVRRVPADGAAEEHVRWDDLVEVWVHTYAETSDRRGTELDVALVGRSGSRCHVPYRLVTANLVADLFALPGWDTEVRRAWDEAMGWIEATSWDVATGQRPKEDRSFTCWRKPDRRG